MFCVVTSCCTSDWVRQPWSSSVSPPSPRALTTSRRRSASFLQTVSRIDVIPLKTYLLFRQPKAAVPIVGRRRLDIGPAALPIERRHLIPRRLRQRGKGGFRLLEPPRC